MLEKVGAVRSENSCCLAPCVCGPSLLEHENVHKLSIALRKALTWLNPISCQGVVVGSSLLACRPQSLPDLV